MEFTIERACGWCWWYYLMAPCCSAMPYGHMPPSLACPAIIWLQLTWVPISFKCFGFGCPAMWFLDPNSVCLGTHLQNWHTNAIQYSFALHCNGIEITLHWNCIALKVLLHCIALKLHCIAVCRVALCYCIVLHCIALYCIALHCIEIHWI